MSRRQGSSINSHFFTSDPVFISETGSRHGSNNNAYGSTFFTKGAVSSPTRDSNVNQNSLNSLLPSGGSAESSSSSTQQPSSATSQPSSSSGPAFPTISSITNSKSSSSSSSSGSASSSNEPDVFTVEASDGPLQVDRSLLRETLMQLKGDSQTFVNQLSAEKTEAFKSVLEALRMLYNNPSAYEVVLSDIRHEFQNITTVKPGTVAAFFIGCFTSDKFPGPIGCSPKCVASVFPANGTPDYNHCEDLVLIYSDGIFSSLNEKRSTHAYIYVGESKFSGFSVENLAQLKDAGIENASIVFGNPDGTFREVTSVLSLDQLPKRNVQINAHGNGNGNGNGNGTNNGNTGGSTTTTTGSAGGVILLIIIIVVIAILLFLVYRDYYR